MTTQANVSEVSICNMALTALGRDEITAMDQVNSDEAKLARIWYPIARNSLLEQAPWTFATKWWVNAAPLSGVSTPRFSRGYAWPTNAVKVWELYGLPEEKWAVEDKRIFCDLATISLRYTEAVEDPSRFSYTFLIALSKWLESMWAIPLTGKRDRRTEAMEEARFWIGEAASSDGQQGYPQETSPRDLERVRW